MKLPEVKIKKILYATDLSESARYAFAYAVSLADLYGAGITFLHVLPEIPQALDASVVGYISAGRWEEIKQLHFNEAKDALIQKRRDHLAVRDVLDQFYKDATSNMENINSMAEDILVVRGNPVEQILLQSEEKNCDLIVMGTYGHGSFTDVVPGSTARRVVRRSKKPVLVVRLPEEDN